MNEIQIFRGAEWEVCARLYKLQFRFPFKLALNTRDYTQIVILRIKFGSLLAYGEAALPPYLDETVETVIGFFRTLDWTSPSLSDISTATRTIDESAVGNNAAKAAVDMALHDLYTKIRKQTISDFYRIKSSKPIHSTYTVGISSEAELIKKLDEAREFRIIKLKLGSKDDKALVQTFRKHSVKPFCVDVNQGWTKRDEGAKLAEYLEKQGALFIEQPFALPRFEESNWLRQRVSIPILADESVKRLSDIVHVAEAFDGVNIKLMKSTGIAEAYQMIFKARELGLKIVIGAMAESSLGNTAAAHLAPLSDWVDLDGPMLSKNDPFEGITYKEGAIILPDRFGIGAVAV